MVHDLEVARTALREARLLRADALLGISDGWMSVAQLAFMSREVHAYRKISLVTALSAQKGWTSVRAKRAVSRFATLMKHHGPAGTVIPDKLTVGWLGRSNAGPERMALWADAVNDSEDYAPWPRFPYGESP